MHGVSSLDVEQFNSFNFCFVFCFMRVVSLDLEQFSFFLFLHGVSSLDVEQFFWFVCLLLLFCLFHAVLSR